MYAPGALLSIVALLLALSSQKAQHPFSDSGLIYVHRALEGLAVHTQKIIETPKKDPIFFVCV